jgi:hypothetical protein
MPPIELFAGIDSIRSSETVAPGLPSRAELQQWLVEHDKIEKETEAFDSGELKKFKKFTKGSLPHIPLSLSLSWLKRKLTPLQPLLSATYPRKTLTSSS